MTPDEIALWWCCQTGEKRSAIIGVLVLYASDPFTTLRIAVDAVLNINGFFVGAADYNLWLTTFQVQFVVDPTGMTGLEYAVFDPTFWTSMAAFFVIPGTACPEPCYILKFALSHI